MSKKKEFVEGIDYAITIRKRKKFIKNPKKNICPICENCNHKNLCLNRRNKETMERCNKCKNCGDCDNCDKFHFYNEYEGRLLNLGINANTGKAIRQSFSGKSEEVVLEKLRKQFIKNKEEGIKETIYTPNQTSILELANEIEENKFKLSKTHGAGYNRNMQTIKACSAYNFMFKPIQNVTRTDIERFLQAEKHKSNSSISKEYAIIKNAFALAYKKHLIDRDIALDFNIDPVEKPKSEKREHQLRELPALYILICILLKIDPLPEKIEFDNYRVPITKEMKISIKHLESLSQQTILLAENKINNLEELKSYRYNLEEKVRILKGKRENLWRKRKKETNSEIKEKYTHEIDDLKALIKQANKDIVNCFEIENRTILLKNQLEFEKSKEIVKVKKKDKPIIR